MNFNILKVVSILEDLHEKQKIIQEQEIDDIILCLKKSYKIESLDQMYFINFQPEFVMSYDFIDENILINYESLLNACFESYQNKKIKNEINEIDYINFIILDCIIHELIHAKQKDRIKKKDDNISKLLMNENNFLIKDNSNIIEMFKSMYHHKIYKEYHDYFISEINANVNASLETYKIAQECSNVYLNDVLYLKILSTIMKSQKNNKTEYLHKEILKDYDLYKETFGKTKFKNKIYYGYKTEIEDKNEIVKKLITIKN